ncbi:hypothetical protein NQ317_009194 [Molorchus minor]|uniref:Uncharacterized protein n=1 Tax=Molorchus minor TaxID=1323400 RepID=A0ABQ9JS94_9CUCU|nr:hypothetical protein NQ317_009194 [Molorchus minor]
MNLFLNFVLVIFLSFQCSTAVRAQSDLKDNATIALGGFYQQIQESSTQVNTTAPDLWASYLNETGGYIYQRLEKYIQDFNLLVSNVTTFANNFNNTERCLAGLDMVYEKLLKLSEIEIENNYLQYLEIQQEFSVQCLANQTNCDGISRSVIAEIDRLLPPLTWIPKKLLAEIHILGYRLLINWGTISNILNTDYYKAIQNATICIASVVEDFSQIGGSTISIEGTVLDAYTSLLLETQSTYLQSLRNMVQDFTAIVYQSNDDFTDALHTLVNATEIAYDIAEKLLDNQLDVEASVRCPIPEFSLIYNSSMNRLASDYIHLESEILSGQYNSSLSRVGRTLNETVPIRGEVVGCVGNTTCDYLLGKIANKTFEIPMKIQRVGNATSVLWYQAIPSFRESSDNIVRDALEQYEIGLVAFKSCILRLDS